MNVGIIGTGYVGLVTGAFLAKIGHKVTCVDHDKAKIKTLLEGKVPIYESGLKELIDEGRQTGRLLFSTETEEAVKESEIIFICVGTPSKATGEANLSFVEKVATQIAKAMSDYKIIVEKSTVPVETGERIRQTVKRNNKHNVPFDVVSNPEFLREGSAVYDCFNPDRIVIGTESPKATEMMRQLYSPILDKTGAPLIVTDIKTSELIKHASNAFLATKISFINALSIICDRTEADISQVAEGMGLDKRIGRSFLNAGIGYGGSCFPKDVNAFIHIASRLGYEFNLLKAVEKINREQANFFISKIKEALWNLEDKRIGVWGLAFKPDTDDMRNAPSIPIINSLFKEGATIKAYDPAAMDRAREIMRDVEYVDNPFEAAEQSDCLIILTEWEEFKQIDLERTRDLLKFPIIIDGRNVFDPGELREMGFTYISMGRPSTE